MKDETEKKIWTVYLIEYQGNVKYIGKTCDFKRRKWRHLNGYGAIPTGVDLNEVEIMPIETYAEEIDALKREDELILQYDTMNTGWNKMRSGLVWSNDTKAYQREYMREYEKTEKRKAYHREYNREWEKTRRQTEKRKAYQREWQKQYRLRKKAEKLAS